MLELAQALGELIVKSKWFSTCLPPRTSQFRTSDYDASYEC